MQTRKMKGLKRGRDDENGDEAGQKAVNGDHEMGDAAEDSDMFEGDEDDDDEVSNVFDSEDSGGIELIADGEGDEEEIDLDTASEAGDGVEAKRRKLST